jgi:hypothetical protein
MVEIDYLSSFYKEVNRLEIEQPRALQWESVIGPPPENVYLFRDENAEVILQYGKINHKNIRLLDVQKAEQLIKPHSQRQHQYNEFITGPIASHYFPYYVIGIPNRYSPETKIGLIDSLGKVVLKKEYQGIYKGDQTFITVKGKRYELRDLNLNLLTSSSKYQMYHDPKFKNYVVIKRDDKIGLMQSDGKIFIPAKYDMFLNGFNADGLMVVYKGGLHGLVNDKGKVIIPPKYKNLYAIKDGVMIASNESYIKGYLDYKANIVIPFKYNHAFGFVDGLARVSVKKDDYYYFGFIDKEGNEVIPLQYSSATDFENGIAKVRLDFPENRNDIKVYRSINELDRLKPAGDWVTIDTTGTVID